MSSGDVDRQPIQISIAPSILPFRVSPLAYFRDNPQYTNLAVGACIFSNETPAGLLLVQRAATELGFPNLWEIPGGSVDSDDPTILHGLAREVFEETGLRLTRFVCAIGEGITFTTGPRRLWMKLSFEIEVQGGANRRSEIVLDPAEHQAYKWVTEEDISLWGAENIVTQEQKEVMLLAFEQRRRAKARHA